MYKTKQMEDLEMRKSKLLAVFTAATLAMTMAVPTVMPTYVTVKAAEQTTEKKRK